MPTVILGLVLIVMVAAGCGSDEPLDQAPAYASLYLPASMQAELQKAENFTDFDIELGPSVSACETMWSIFRGLLYEDRASSGEPITEPEANAAAAPNGGLFVFVASWTQNNGQALDIVQQCVPYYVGQTP